MRRVEPLHVAPPSLDGKPVQVCPELDVSRNEILTYEEVDGGLLVCVQYRVVEVPPDVLWGVSLDWHGELTGQVARVARPLRRLRGAVVRVAIHDGGARVLVREDWWLATWQHASSQSPWSWYI